jgi:hypothetical protein
MTQTYNSKIMEKLNIESFLKLGYFLNYSKKHANFNFPSKANYADLTESDLVSLGSTIFQSAINNNFKTGQSHLVPISGGLDSRAILAGLLDCTEAKNIYTYTFGQPGSYDFDIGNFLAKKIGTNHASYNLRDEPWDINELVTTAKRFRRQTNLFFHPNISKIQQEYLGINYWSGFMGGEIAGCHMDRHEGDSLQTVKLKFIKNNTFVSSVNLNSSGSEALLPLIEVDPNLRDSVSLTENIDFTNRQLKYVAPHVLSEGMSYKLPFLDADWAQFILSVDNEMRFDTKIYKAILVALYPKIFSYPIKDNHGLTLDAPQYKLKAKKISHRLKSKVNQFYNFYHNPFTNYLEFNSEIRSNSNLREVLRTLTDDLKARDVVGWIDIDSIWERHLKSNKDHADALITLASLELNFKAERQ